MEYRLLLHPRQRVRTREMTISSYYAWGFGIRCDAYSKDYGVCFPKQLINIFGLPQKADIWPSIIIWYYDSDISVPSVASVIALDKENDFTYRFELGE